MSTVLTTTNQTIEIAEVTNVVVTEAIDDGEGGFVREIRIFGYQGDQFPAVLTARIKSANKAGIELTTPALDF